MLLSHPTGNQNVREAAKALQEKGLLGEFHTALAACNHNIFSRLARMPGLREVERRRCAPELGPYLKFHPFRESARLLAGRLGMASLVRHETGPFCVDAVFRNLDRSIARKLRSVAGCDAVYGYEDGALETFRAANELQITCIYDLPIGYWRAARRIQSEEAERQPEWAGTMPALVDSAAKLERKDEELKRADHIIVASSFTAGTLEEAPFPLPDVSVIPYGCPDPVDLRKPIPDASPGKSPGKLRVLFVGGLSQRKGLSYLLEAIEETQSIAELTLIGRRPAVSCKPLESALQKFTYIESLPHAGILEQMARHDVFVFPSLFEGFGLVLTEALSQGLPVITTSHTCGPDLLTEGKEGFIVPIRDSRAIAERLVELHHDPERLAEMRLAALRKAGQVTWAQYRRQLGSTVSAIIGQ